MRRRVKVQLIVPSRPYLLNPKALPNLGVLYVAYELRRLGVDVVVTDFAFEEERRILEDVDIVGITMTTADFHEVANIVRQVREVNPKAKIVCGGPHATLAPSECLRIGCDSVCVGDGEPAIRNLVRDYVETGRVDPIYVGYAKNIDEFYPDRRIVDLRRYDFKIVDVHATPMMTARSCAWRRCAFCSRLPPPWDYVRYHSVEHVRRELEEILDIGFKGVMIYDDEFLTHPKRDVEIVKLIRDLGFKAWRCFIHSKLFLKTLEKVPNLMKLLVESNLKEVLIGVESGSNKILQVIEKGVTVEENEKVIKLFKEYGIRVKAAMIVGLPSESKETLMETWRWLEKMENYIDDYDFVTCTPYPGSKIYKMWWKYDLKFDFDSIYTAYKGMHTKDWRPCRIWTSSLSFEEILRWRNAFEKRFKFKDYTVKPPI